MSRDKAEVWRAEWRAYKEYAEQAFDRYVTKANDLVRQLALAGIAVVWVFRETTATGAVNVPAQLRWAAILFVLCLTLDLIHYLYGTWDTSTRLEEIKTQEDGAIASGTPWPADPSGPPPDLPQGGVRLFFWLKTA